LRRLALLVLLLSVFIAGGLIALAVSASTSPPVVHYRQVVAHDLNGAISTLDSIIKRYTSH
jgi:hypothetical protein